MCSSTYSICLDRDGTSLRVLHDPGPATALDASESCIELFLHCVEAAVGRVDGLGQSARGRLTSASRLGRKVLPEEGVVDVAAYGTRLETIVVRYRCSCRTSMKVDQRLSRNLGLNVASVLRLGHLFRRCIQRGDVGVVVLGVVKLHDLAANGWLEFAIAVCGVRSVVSRYRLLCVAVLLQVRASHRGNRWPLEDVFTYMVDPGG